MLNIDLSVVGSRLAGRIRHCFWYYLIMDMFVFVMGIYVDISFAYFMEVPVVKCNELTKANHKVGPQSVSCSTPVLYSSCMAISRCVVLSAVEEVGD